MAPNLTGYLSEVWLKEFIRNPADMKFYGARNKMPKFDKLSENELDALVQYLLSLSKDRTLVSEKDTRVNSVIVLLCKTSLIL